MEIRGSESLGWELRLVDVLAPGLNGVIGTGIFLIPGEVDPDAGAAISGRGEVAHWLRDLLDWRGGPGQSASAGRLRPGVSW